MTYEEMKQEVYNLDLESMEHGIKVKEYDHPKRFEAAGLGIIDLSQIECYGPIGLYEIYSGKWGTDNKKTIARIVPDCNDTQYEQYLSMLKDIKAEYLKKRAEEKQRIMKETGYKTASNFTEDLDYIGTTVIFHGIECKVSSKYDKTRYRLIAMDGTKEQLQNDKSFTEYHMWGAVALPITCPACKGIFWFDDMKISDGENYETQCPHCAALLKRKKI